VPGIDKSATKSKDRERACMISIEEERGRAEGGGKREEILREGE
jgi:hypothetical protein